MVGDREMDKGSLYRERIEDLQYCRGIKQFLQRYKTKKCARQDKHNSQDCPDYHTPQEKRRNPYSTHYFLYYPFIPCICINEKCPNYKNTMEYHYHPLIYKTIKCPVYNQCPGTLQCPYLHHHDEQHFGQGQFFRFDLALFKTKPCPHKEQHQKKVCLYYHNQKDRRRPNFYEYNHILCHKDKCMCQKSHNKIEQLYHPSRYKSKYCQTYSKDINKCEYRDFCSFAHTKEEIAVDLIDGDNKDPTYIVNKFKTVWCPFTIDHDRSNCPYAHNIQDYRRNPKEYKYLPQKCQSWNFSDKIESIEEAGCKAGMNCNKCHGWMQLRYHPQVYYKKLKTYINKEEIIEKKLILKDACKQKKISNIANKEIQLNKTNKYTVGAPFFKSQREQSEASKKTKAKTGNIESQKSCNDSQGNNKDETKHNIKPKNISSLYFENEDHLLWNFTEQGKQAKEKQLREESRSRSQGKSDQYEPSYTQSIKELFKADVELMEKLKEKKVNEVSLVTMKEKKINCIPFLDSEEKQKLICKLREYSLKKDPWIIEYSAELTRFFVKNNADQILQKLRERKIKQEKVLKLQSRQATKDFSFLKEEEKELLPKLLKVFHQEKQFGSLMKSVSKFVEQSSHE